MICAKFLELGALTECCILLEQTRLDVCQDLALYDFKLTVKSIGKCEISNSVSSDHNPVLLSLKNPHDS